MSFQPTKIIGSAPGMVDKKIRDLSILISRETTYVGQKRNREMDIIDNIHLKGLKKFENRANTLTPVYIEIKNYKLRTFAS